MYKRKPLQQLKERVTDGAEKSAGPGLRWAQGAFRRMYPFCTQNPYTFFIIQYTNE
jgi:hypothetical protein